MGGVIVYIRYAVFSNVTEKTYFGRWAEQWGVGF
jgi:hypothetical protein